MGINDPSYVALVAALRGEFGLGALAAMNLQLRPHRGNPTSLGVLVDAVRDAGDVGFDSEPGTPCGLIKLHGRHEWITAPLDEGGEFLHCRGAT